MDGVERPLSPHLQVYRWQITNTLSILHRFTGVLLSMGAFVLAAWLIAIASGAQAYAGIHALFSGIAFRLLFAALAFAFFYHLANGVRHLFWDAGYGFEHVQYRVSGWAVVVFSVLATVIYVIAAII
jgi:succinate dehydrogenase / fumarate reductase, cytochrome b subunit